MYKRVAEVADKIRESRLKFDEWRVLFAVDSNSSTQKIADFLELSTEKVTNALDHLSEVGLILSDDSEVAQESSPVEEKEIAEATEEILEEIVEEETPVAEEAIADEEIVIEEEPAAEEAVAEEEIIIEEEPAAEEAVADEEIVIGEEPAAVETIAEEDIVIEEEPAVEETIADEEIVIEEKPAEEAPADEKEDTPAPAGSKKILVVDDSIVIRKMVEIALENENFTIETAVSGKEALQKVDAVDPDLVILDIMLPDVSGIEILKAIKASKGLPVIMLSGKNSPQDIELAKAQGADDFAPKPFKEEELVEKIKALVK